MAQWLARLLSNRMVRVRIPIFTIFIFSPIFRRSICDTNIYRLPNSPLDHYSHNRHLREWANVGVGRIKYGLSMLARLPGTMCAMSNKKIGPMVVAHNRRSELGWFTTYNSHRAPSQIQLKQNKNKEINLLTKIKNMWKIQISLRKRKSVRNRSTR